MEPLFLDYMKHIFQVHIKDMELDDPGNNTICCTTVNRLQTGEIKIILHHWDDIDNLLQPYLGTAHSITVNLFLQRKVEELLSDRLPFPFWNFTGIYTFQRFYKNNGHKDVFGTMSTELDWKPL